MVNSSRSPRKDNLSSGRAEIRKNPELPLTADEAIKYYGRYLNDYEKQEIQAFSGDVYYLGQNCRSKVKGHVIKMVANTNSKINNDRRSSLISN